MPESNQKVVTCAQLLRQAVADWQDKEVRNGYTLTYVWMANQLGHFALGFLSTLALVWFVGLFVEGSLCAWAVAIAVALVVIFALKEWRDYSIARDDAKGNPFDFDGWDILLDALTAVAFFAFGVLAACVSVQSTRWALVVLGVGLVLSLLPACYWLARKYCFQRATMPYQFRLADFDGSLCGTEQAVHLINDFWQGKGCDHLLIFGATGTGRTTLAVGILTEHCFKVHRGRYLTWVKFIENAPMTAGEQNALQVWPWQESDIVVLDDVVRVVDGRAIDTPGMVADELNRLSDAAKQLGGLRTVWVLGPADGALAQAWIDALPVALRAERGTFEYVSLNAPVAKRRRRYLSSFLGH